MGGVGDPQRKSRCRLDRVGCIESLPGVPTHRGICSSQMLVYMFYALPFYGLAAYALIFPGCSWLPDWALVFAGAIGQVRWGWGCWGSGA